MSLTYDKIMVSFPVAMVTVSFMLMRKRIGESGDPCGVPLSVLKYLDVLPLNLYAIHLRVLGARTPRKDLQGKVTLP